MKTVFILVFVALSFSSRAQSNVGVLNPVGFSFHNDSMFAAVSIGEPIIQTLQSNSVFITQGFLQTDFEATNLHSIWTGKEPIVYPNPFDKQIQISNAVSYTQYCLYDCYGKLIDSNTFSPTMNLEHLNASTYLLVLYSENNQVIRSFKIVKLY